MPLKGTKIRGFLNQLHHFTIKVSGRPLKTLYCSLQCLKSPPKHYQHELLGLQNSIVHFFVHPELHPLRREPESSTTWRRRPPSSRPSRPKRPKRRRRRRKLPKKKPKCPDPWVTSDSSSTDNSRPSSRGSLKKEELSIRYKSGYTSLKASDKVSKETCVTLDLK